MKRIIIVFILATLFALWAAEPLQCLPKKTVTGERNFGFGEMEIFDFSNDTSNLYVYDFNNDGLDDILFLNNQKSRLEILIRKKDSPKGQGLPTLEERFENRGFLLDQWVKRFRVADIDGDNALDLITLDSRKGIQVYIRNKAGNFDQPRQLAVDDVSKVRGFRAEDLDGDNSPDILLYRQDNSDILWNNGKGSFKTPTRLGFSAYGCGGAMAADVNGDNIQDLLYYFPKELMPLRLRLGKGKRKYGWEEPLAMPDIRALEKAEFLSDGACQVAVLLKNGLILRLYQFEPTPTVKLFETRDIIPKRLPMKGLNQSSAPSWVVADTDADGFDDFCIAAPLLNQVHLYKGSANGLSFEPITVDSLRDIKSMGLTGQGDLMVFSEAEKTVAFHSHKMLTAFPRFLKATGEPLAVSTAGDSSIFALFKNDARKDKFQIHRFDTNSPHKKAVQSFDIQLANAPDYIKIFALDGQDNWLALLFMPYEKPKMLHLRNGKSTAMTPDQFTALGADLKPGDITAFNDGQQFKLLVTEGNVARIYSWETDRFTVSGQLNPRSETANLAAGFHWKRNGSSKYLLYDDTGQKLYRFDPAKPVASKTSRMDIKDGVKDIAGLAVMNMKQTPGILLVGQREIQWLREGEDSQRLKNLSEYVTSTDKPALWDLFSINLGNPSRPMLALLDSKSRSIELVGLKEGKLAEELVFEVFQDAGFNNRMAESVYEPHDLETGDFNGDNIADMAVLVHNKLILYLGE